MDAVRILEDEVREVVRRQGVDPQREGERVRLLIHEAVSGYESRSLVSSLPPLDDAGQARQDLYDCIAGLGPLQRLMDDPGVEEIWLNAPSRAGSLLLHSDDRLAAHPRSGRSPSIGCTCQMTHPAPGGAKRPGERGKWMASKQRSLGNAKAAKDDEFYTQLSDIEKEVRHYKKHFKDKVVYLNCDDPRESEFFHYFSYNFEKLGLKKLIAACYKSQDIDLFSTEDSEQAVYLEYTGDKDGDRIPGRDEIEVQPFRGDGDFRSPESVGLLQQADIVVTNPPFSLFREYIAQLIKYDKKFLVIGNMNAVTYKEIWPHVEQNRIWLGVTRAGTGQMWFRINDDFPVKSGQRTDENGQRWQTIGSSAWFTNLDHTKRHEDLILYKKYDPALYPAYDNYDAIEVSKAVDIPMDFGGIMGVPITFLGKHNPDQFDIVGTTESNDPDNPHRTRWYSSQECREAYFERFGKPGVYDLNAAAVVDGEKKFKRILIRRKGADK
ncbi:adenine-specific methyltransferase EcoRI family protein [Micrococcus sp. NPDC078436]|uniref:adenine-specific methyltransferase EcoRI family protein n=1 Tax=Micrococcus sp. NPDC078436 TaxID=3154960 RepID=UPI00344E13FD